MSTEQKVALAREAQGEHALSSVLEVLELPRSTWYYHQNHRVSYTAKYAHLREPLETIAREHPEYGYRRTTAELREAYGYRINHKVVQRVHQEWDLPLIRGTRLPKPSGIRQVIAAAGERINLAAVREAIRPFGVAYTDFTELVYADGRQKAQLIPIVDHASKLALGWAVGVRQGSLREACGDGPGAGSLGAGQADPQDSRSGPERGDRSSRPGSRVHWLRLDLPPVAKGPREGILCPQRGQRQSADGVLHWPILHTGS